MKFFLDTEFIESGPYHPIQLISLGLVGDNGSELYCISSEYDASLANQWVRNNVLDKINTNRTIEFLSLKDIAGRVTNFVKENDFNNKPEFWGYYADYDWVVFCQLFGTMMNLPKNFPMFCRDLKQWCKDLGDPQLPKQVKKEEHNALNDARWNKSTWEFLYQLSLGVNL